MRQIKAFTLVELLVVIGIIALLISVLLPALGRARASAQTVACLSNLRSIGQAAMMMASEKKGQLPPASDKRWAMMHDPSRTKFLYRQNPSGGTPDLLDWASHLLPYMGAKGQVVDFNSAPGEQSRVFVCPSDPVTAEWNSPSSPGFTLFNNVVTATQRISYGINIDIVANTDTSDGIGKFGLSDQILVYQADAGGTPIDSPKNSPPLNGKLNRVRNSSTTMLFADAGTFPPASGTALDLPQVLAYTTNYIMYSDDPTGLVTANSGTRPELRHTLAGVARTSWLRRRIPLERHGKPTASIRQNNDNLNAASYSRLKAGRINVCFADGHAETVSFDDFGRVNVSPYAPR